MNDLRYAFEYYQKVMPTKVDNLTFDSIHDLSRPYQITATIDPDGKATLVWKPAKTDRALRW